jgi:hypothetical protein
MLFSLRVRSNLLGTKRPLGASVVSADGITAFLLFVGSFFKNHRKVLMSGRNDVLGGVIGVFVDK